MSWEILALVGIAIIAVLIGVFWKKPIVKKYWKYALIPAVIVIVIRLMSPKGDEKKEQKRAETLRKAIDGVKDDIQEAQMEAAIEVSAARAKSNEKLEELKEIKKIPDKKERRRRLADMIG